MRDSLAPAILGSIVLHALVVGVAIWRFPTQAREIISAVPVQIVSDVPQRAAAPAQEQGVVEDLPTEPEPEPEPAPAPPPPEKKAPTPPPPKKKQEASLDLDALTDSLKSPRPARRNLNAASKGTSNTGSAAQDMGPALDALTQKLMRLWSPNCGVEGADQITVRVSFMLSDGGRVVRGPRWENARMDPTWQAAGQRAISAVKRGEPYEDLPEGLYNEPLIVNFNGREACR